MFTTHLDVRKIGPNRWFLLMPLIYEGSKKITVPTGFTTDFASVPRFFWRIVPPAAGNHAKPSVLHDFLCEYSSDQPEADRLFLEALKANGVGWFKRTTMYWAVRIYQTAKGKYKKVQRA